MRLGTWEVSSLRNFVIQRIIAEGIQAVVKIRPDLTLVQAKAIVAARIVGEGPVFYEPGECSFLSEPHLGDAVACELLEGGELWLEATQVGVRLHFCTQVVDEETLRQLLDFETWAESIARFRLEMAAEDKTWAEFPGISGVPARFSGDTTSWQQLLEGLKIA